MRSVLIIEDDTVLSQMYSDKFTVGEFDVYVAKDGEEGLKMALDHKPDLLLLDLVMPKMDGTALMEKLRSDSWGKNVPIIVLTNLNVDGKVLNEIIKSKPVYCLLKANTTPEEVFEKAKEFLDNPKKYE